MARSKVKPAAVFTEDNSADSETISASRQALNDSVLADLILAKRSTMQKFDEADKKIEELFESINRIEGQNKEFEKRMDEKFDKTQDSIRSSEIRSVQVLGTLAALISLVLAYVNIASAQKDLLNALFVLLTATFGIILFIVLINQILDEEGRRAARNAHLLWISAIGLGFIMLLAFAKTYSWDLSSTVERPFNVPIRSFIPAAAELGKPEQKSNKS